MSFLLTKIHTFWIIKREDKIINNSIRYIVIYDTWYSYTKENNLRFLFFTSCSEIFSNWPTLVHLLWRVIYWIWSWSTLRLFDQFIFGFRPNIMLMLRGNCILKSARCFNYGFILNCASIWRITPFCSFPLNLINVLNLAELLVKSWCFGNELSLFVSRDIWIALSEVVMGASVCLIFIFKIRFSQTHHWFLLLWFL